MQYLLIFCSILFSPILDLLFPLILLIHFSRSWRSFVGRNLLTNMKHETSQKSWSEFHWRMWAHLCNLDLHIHLMNFAGKFGSQFFFLKEVECQEESSWGGGTEGCWVGETNWSCHITQIRLCLLEHRRERRVNQCWYQRHTRQSIPTEPDAQVSWQNTTKSKSRKIKKRKL